MVLFFDEILKHNIQIYNINENFDMSSPIGKANVNIIIVMAKLEREQISLAAKQRLDALIKSW